MRALWMVRSAAALCLVTAMAAAQSDETARRAARDLGNEGIELYEKGDYPNALDRLDRAYQVMSVPTLGLWSARALEKNGLLVEASERYLAVTRAEVAADAPDVQREAVRDAQREYDALQPRIPTVTILLQAGETTAGVEISIDGQKLRAALLGVPIVLDPGKHEFQVTREGKQLHGEVDLVEGDRKRVELTFKEPTSTTPDATSPVTPTNPTTTPVVGNTGTTADTGVGHPGRTQRIAGFAVLGLGVAGLAVGGIEGATALNKQDSLDAWCPNGRDQCLDGAQDIIDEYDSARTLSTVGFVVGGVAAAGGVVLILTAPHAPRAGRSVEPWIGVGSAGLRGRF
jgi:hypothetical protein